LFWKDDVPCCECGVVVPRVDEYEHVCQAEQRLEYQLTRLKPGILKFEQDLAAYLDSPQGRFELWYAKRRRHSAILLVA
jgi:hypothetical protein